MCEHCGMMVRKDEDLITRMKRGPCAGKYIHQACAYEWYTSNK